MRGPPGVSPSLGMSRQAAWRGHCSRRAPRTPRDGNCLGAVGAAFSAEETRQQRRDPPGSFWFPWGREGGLQGHEHQGAPEVVPGRHLPLFRGAQDPFCRQKTPR